MCDPHCIYMLSVTRCGYCSQLLLLRFPIQMLEAARSLARAPGDFGRALAGSGDVVTVLETRIDDYKNVLNCLKKDASGTFNHEATRLSDAVQELEKLYAKHVETKNGFVRLIKGFNRAIDLPEIVQQMRTIDEAAIRQFTAVAAKSAIGGQRTTGGYLSHPSPWAMGFGPRLKAGNSELATRRGEGGTAWDYAVSTWSGRQRMVYVVVCGARCALLMCWRRILLLYV